MAFLNFPFKVLVFTYFKLKKSERKNYKKEAKMEMKLSGKHNKKINIYKI